MATMQRAKEASAKVFTLFIANVATLRGFLFEYDSVVINGTVDRLQPTFNSEDQVWRSQDLLNGWQILASL